MTRILPITLALLAAACGSNPYGYAPEYAPLSAEEDFLEEAVELSYEDVRRDPAAFQQRIVGWFGVVTAVTEDKGTQAPLVHMELRYHQPRHLCTDEYDSSCRVTISEKTGGPFSARLVLRPEDAAGRGRLNVGSLVKVYGMPTMDYDEQGGPVLDARYYRHWPHATFVSTRRRANMRR